MAGTSAPGLLAVLPGIPSGPPALAQVPGSDTISILLRLDRNPSTEAIGAFFSVNDGASWTALGASIVKSLANPRLAIFIGANGSTSSFPTADINWVEIVANPSASGASTGLPFRACF